jgi:hypothetical protein
MPSRRRPLDRLADSIQRNAMRTIRGRLRKATTAEEAQRIFDAANEALQNAIPETIHASASHIADAMDRTMPEMLANRHELTAGFENRLYATWKDGLDRLEALVHAYFEFGAKYYADGFHPDAGEQTAAFVALSHLHARGCRVAGEIYTLLKSGFADGAHARWRTLHEIAIIAQFIAKHGDATAEQYLLHDGIRAFKAAKRLEEHTSNLAWDPVKPVELRALEENRNALVSRFGKSFSTEFGWALSALGSHNNVGLGHLEADLGLGHWRPFYAWASDGVHGGPGGLWPMGVADHGGPYLLAGPSNAAIADPAQNTALSLAQILSALFTHRSTLDSASMVAGFNVLVVRCQDALMRIQVSVQKRTAANARRRKANRKRKRRK